MHGATNIENALLKSMVPHASLRDYVREYQVFRFVFDGKAAPPPKFHAPRPEHCITFYLRDCQKFSRLDSAEVIAYPKCVVNGIYNRPIYRHGGLDFWAIKVVLQPSAFYHFLRIPSTHITNTFLDAEALWGKDVRSTCEQLDNSPDLTAMIGIIERFLTDRIRKSPEPLLPIDRAVQHLLSQGTGGSVESVASQSCLSVRQFIRKFEERVGVSAKTFNRIVRFNKAYRLKNNQPELDWLFIALATGYCDYQHLAKEFQEFTTLTPRSFYEIEKTSPERHFGLHEG